MDSLMSHLRRKRYVLVLGALWCAALLGAFGAAKPSAASETADAKTTGLEALERKDYAAAIVALRAALEAEPGSRDIAHNLALAYNNYGVSLLEEGRHREAETALRAAARIEPDDDEIRGNLGRAYNAHGVALIKAGSYRAAENTLLEAIRWQPDEPMFRRNLAVAMAYRGKALYERKDTAAAFHALRGALKYDPENAAVLLLLGEICYEQQDLGWALYYLRAAYETDPEQFAALEERIATIEREAQVEGAFERQAHGVFDIRYDGELEEFDVESLRAHLNDAYYSVGGQLSYYPKHTVVVLVYHPDDFARLRSVPEWVAGLYDGKIRVPAAKAMKDEASKRLIRHEYTHALVSDLADDRCAIWLNEGLAKYMEYHDVEGGMPTPLVERRLRTGDLIPFDELQGEFIKIEGREKVQLAYEQSYHLVAYIIDKYGMWKIHRMLAQYAAGKETATVLLHELNRSPKRFEEDWLRYLERKLD
jgi:tetratricopeptide (TPR) repeat protein